MQMNVYDWGDDSEDTSNVFSGVDEQKSRKSGYSIASSTRPDRINEEIEVVRKKHRLSQSQSNLRKGVGGGIADVVMYPPVSPRQATPLTRSKNKNKVQFGKIRLTNNRNRKNDTEPYYAPVNSPDSSEASRRGREQEKRAEHSQSTNSGWFPMPSIGNLISNPSDELSHPKQPGETNSRSTSGRLAEAFSMFADTRLGASPVKVQPKKKEKIRTNPFASSSAESESFGEHEHGNGNENVHVQKNMNNKAQSKESYPHGPNSPQASRKNLTRGRPNTYINPFDSTSLSPANSTDYKSNKTHANANANTNTNKNTNTNSPSRSRRKSRSPSPIYQRPSRDTIRDSGKSEFHNLISCASSPDDELFIDALEMLATSSNPRQLVKVKLLDAHNWTALHIAALSNPPLFLIYAILLVFPEAAKQEDTAGRLPLHLAAGSESNITLLNTLVRFHNEGICTKDHRGLVPLHLTLLRDGDEEISVDVLRILLGQNIGAGDAEIMIGKKSDRRVRDGDMRNGKHLNLQLNEIHGGVLGISRNAIMTKERKQREVLMRLTNKGPKDKLSRGFARDIDDIDSQDGNPHTHEHLSSLWLSERNAIRDPFEKMERQEANMFSPEVQHCLRKLANWKKKYNREQTQEVVEEPEPVPIVNPATIPAPPYMRLPVHMAVRRNHKKTKSSNEEHRKNSPLALPPNQNELLRILIHAFPLSLMIRDTQDQTPLMTCLNLVHYPAIHPVDLDMIELLLGIRTSGFRAAPNWLEDADFFQRHQHSIAYGSSNQFNGSLCITSNAAMIPSEQTLPLHIAARESLPLSIIHAIYTCYPGAKYAQDERNCTPLHCALQNVTGRDKLEIEMIRVLTDEKVLRIKNSLHQTIYDLLVYNAEIRKLPRFWKCHSSGASGSSFLPIFEHAVKDQVLNPSGGIGKEKFFSQLSSLPSWLRREACATPAVQILLIEEMTNSINFALISFYGIIFLAHLIAFNSLIDTITVPEADNVQVVTSYFEKIFILITNIYLSIHGMLHTLAAIRFNTGIFDTASNLWSWVTFVALFSSLFVVFRIGIQERTSGAVDLSDRLLRTMSTIAVGFLWASLLGYFARWWYGVSRFCSSFAKMTTDLFSPLIVLTVFVLAFTQMAYVIHPRGSSGQQCLYQDRDSSGDSVEICSLWDSFKIVYLLIIGEGFLGAEASSDNSTIIILLVFILLAFLLILHMISLSIFNLRERRLSYTTSVNSFWSPMLVHVLFIRNLRGHFCRKGSNEESLSSRLENMWDYIIFSYSNVDIKDTKWWYLQQDLGKSHLLGKKWFVRIIGAFIMPLWICLGAVSFGILWPPQFRQWIFQVKFDDDEQKPVRAISTRGATSLQSDISNMKMMLYDRFQGVETELYELRSAFNEYADEDS